MEIPVSKDISRMSGNGGGIPVRGAGSENVPGIGHCPRPGCARQEVVMRIASKQGARGIR